MARVGKGPFVRKCVDRGGEMVMKTRKGGQEEDRGRGGP